MTTPMGRHEDGVNNMNGATAGDVNGRYIPSTANNRTMNNVVRHEYRVLSDEEKVTMVLIKDLGLKFITLVNSLPTSRENSIAITKMEEAVMWAVKSITK